MVLRMAFISSGAPAREHLIDVLGSKMTPTHTAERRRSPAAGPDDLQVDERPPVGDRLLALTHVRGERLARAVRTLQQNAALERDAEPRGTSACVRSA